MTLRSGGHIRVRLILSRLGPSAHRTAEILVSFIAFVFCVFFTYALFKFTSNSYELGEKSIASNTPVWIPQAFVTFGVLLMALQFLARVVRTLAGLAVELPAFEPDEVLSTIVLDKN
jgi:TRAP-type C4-dicarboxylate transport system permease small subunit